MRSPGRGAMNGMRGLGELIVGWRFVN